MEEKTDDTRMNTSLTFDTEIFIFNKNMIFFLKSD